MELERIEAELPDSARDIFQQGWCKLTPEQLAVFVDFLLRHPGNDYTRRSLLPPQAAELSAKTDVSNLSIVFMSLELTLHLLNAKEDPLKALDDLLHDLKTAELLTEDAVTALRPSLVTLIKNYRWVDTVERLLTPYVPVYLGSSSRCIVTTEFKAVGEFREIDPEKYIPTVKALIPAVLLRIQRVIPDKKTGTTSCLLTEVDIDNLIKRLQIAKKQLLATKAHLELTNSE